MVNSKKMSKSSIAVIVLSILLVLSMVLGLTGAWFTDSDNVKDDDIAVNFGSVAISLTDNADGAWTATGLSKGTDNDLVVPGSEYTGTITLANDGTEDVWFKITKATATLTVDGKTISTNVTVEIRDGADAVGTTTAIAKLENEATKTYTVVLTLDTALGNEADGATLNDGAGTSISGVLAFELEIEAVQAANNDGKAGFSA